MNATFSVTAYIPSGPLVIECHFCFGGLLDASEFCRLANELGFKTGPIITRTFDTPKTAIDACKRYVEL